MFASMSAAFEGLSSKMQSMLSGLTAVHDFTYGFKESLEEPGGHERLAEMVANNPPVEHPVIRRHPISGKQCIFVNSLFTVRIKGMKERESRALLDFLYQHVTAPEYTCRFNWQNDSILPKLCRPRHLKRTTSKPCGKRRRATTARRSAKPRTPPKGRRYSVSLPHSTRGAHAACRPKRQRAPLTA